MTEVLVVGTPIIVAVIGLLGGVLTLWLKSKLDRIATSSGAAADSATLAADRSKPTSNGFASGVNSALQRIEARQTITDQRVDALTSALLQHLQEGASRGSQTD